MHTAIYTTIFIFDLIYVVMIAIKMKEFRQEKLDVMRKKSGGNSTILH